MRPDRRGCFSNPVCSKTRNQKPEIRMKSQTRNPKKGLWTISGPNASAVISLDISTDDPARSTKD
jgi:hypothetical protein